MTRIKLCGLMRIRDIEAANDIRPDYIGFVFDRKSRRYVTPQQAALLRMHLAEGIWTVGVFVNETPEYAAQLLNSGIIDIAQLHGAEDETYIRHMRAMTLAPLIQAFRIGGARTEEEKARAEAEIRAGEASTADVVLLDAGAGGGTGFDWTFLKPSADGESAARCPGRPYFLAGGLNPENVTEAVRLLHPYAVDVSSGIETDGVKDPAKMAAFAAAVRAADAAAEKGGAEQ